MPSALPGEAHRLLSAFPLLVWTTDAHGKTTWANHAWHTLIGQDDRTAHERDLAALVHEHDASQVAELFAMPAPPTFDLDVRLRRADDTYHWFRLHGHAQHDENNSGRTWLITGTKIDDLKREQHERTVLQRLIDSSQDCIKVLDLDGRLLSMNEGGRVKMEIDDFEQCRNLPWLDFWQGDARTLVEAALDRAHAGHNTTFEATSSTMKGTLKWWEVSVSPLRDKQGRVHQISAISRDITTRKAAQDALVNLNATLEDNVAERTRQLEEERAALDAFVAFTERTFTADVDELARHAVDVLHATLGDVSVVYFALEGDVWRAKVWSDDVAAEVVEVLTAGVPMDAPSFTEVTRTQDVVFISHWKAEREGIARSDVYGAGALYPCFVADDLRGLLSIGTRRASEWTQRERGVFQAVGRSLKVALERTATARHLQAQNAELVARTKALEAFAELSRDFTVHSEPNALIERALEIALSLLPPGFGMFFELRGSTWQRTIQVGEVGPELQRVLEVGLPVGSTPSLDLPYRTKQALFQDLYDQTRDVPPELVRHVHTGSSLPVLVNGHIAGIFTVAVFEQRQWNAMDRVTLETIAHSLGLALEGAESVSQLAEERRKLQSANEELEAFTYSVSHDLRTPVRHIMGFNQLLRRALADKLDERSSHYMDVVDEGAARMNTLIDAMLDLSRTSRLPLRLGLIDLGPLVASVRAELDVDVVDRCVEWTVAPLPLVMGDPDTLRQVMLNLLSNALKYTRTRDVAVIRVWTEEREEATAVFVGDNGVGYDVRYQDKLFGVFQRLHRQDEFEGTGVGLANVRRIVTRHGGEVMASSEPGRGATFGFTLPKRT